MSEGGRKTHAIYHYLNTYFPFLKLINHVASLKQNKIIFQETK